MSETARVVSDEGPARTAEAIATSAIRAAIVSGELAPGARIHQQASARAIGVSLIPLREALKTLAGEGALTYAPQRGYSVKALQEGDFSEICAVRRLLEAEAERLAVGQLDETDITRLRACLLAQARAVEDGDPVAVVAANRRLHFTIFAKSANAWLLEAIRRPWDALEPYRVLALRRADRGAEQPMQPDIVREHRQIVKAIAKGKHGRALALLAEHREHSGQLLGHTVAAHRR